MLSEILTEDQIQQLQHDLSFSQQCRDIMFTRRENIKAEFEKWSEFDILRSFDALDSYDLQNLTIYIGFDDATIAQIYHVTPETVKSKRDQYSIPEHSPAKNGERALQWLNDPKVFSVTDLKKMFTVA